MKNLASNCGGPSSVDVLFALTVGDLVESGGVRTHVQRLSHPSSTFEVEGIFRR